MCERSAVVRTGVLVAAVAVVAAVETALGAAALAWPRATLAPSQTALTQVKLPWFAGRIVAVEVRGPGGEAVPVSIRGAHIWPRGRLGSGERLAVTVTVRRPGYAGWLVGRTDTETFAVETPSAHLRARWLEVKDGTRVAVAFDTAVSRVKLQGGHPKVVAATAVVPVGVTAEGRTSAGSVEVSAAARTWERLPAPTRVSWFPSRSYPQVLPSPAAGVRIAPNALLSLTFSRPVASVLGRLRPTLVPATPGRWRIADSHTITFRPSGLGYGFGSTVHVRLPAPAHLAGRPMLVRTISWTVASGSTLRLQQLLAGLGYLPVTWHERSDPPASDVVYQLAASLYPPAGTFSWRYPHTPATLKALWQPGRWNVITQAAVMAFENDHHLPVDGAASPSLWQALLTSALTGDTPKSGYSYVYVHATIPETLDLWRDGRVILTSPGNTGIPGAPTAYGTYPVFEHIPVGTMSGTNPDGSHYVDPGIQWISYFHGGDAIHAFPRASYGTPQSLGCVELPFDAAAKAWPYTPIGTLVTVQS